MFGTLKKIFMYFHVFSLLDERSWLLTVVISLELCLPPSTDVKDWSNLAKEDKEVEKDR